MRTKHLFYTAAMAALFAACVNDDFETISKGQNTANDGRPVVGDVKLNFTTGADTRLAFGEDGYAWETNDTIGALLMDNVMVSDPESENYTWLEKYALTANIHTSYPFTYSTAEQTWGCNTKMLEGNYFFAYPWEDYDGERRVRHYLTKQSQEGVGPEVVRESYTKNQFFVGYSQIMAGTDAKDALTDVEMVPMLGAIQLRIVNTGTQTYHINKVVLRGAELASALTFNPTDAGYESWNLEESSLSWINNATTFNYANYTGNEADVYDFNGTPQKVFNIADEDLQEYDRIEALSRVVKPIDNEKYCELVINGTKEQRALISTKTDEDAVAYVLIMANEIENVTDLNMDIYTDEGIVQNVDLTKVPGSEAETDVYGAIINSAVKKISIDTKNTIGVQIDDNSFREPKDMEIYNSADLKQFIQWNYNVDGAREATATLMKDDVELTAEMADMLAKKSNLVLNFKNESGSFALDLAEDLPADILDYENLNIATPVNVLGTITISAKSDLPKVMTSTLMTIEEGAVLNINDEIDAKNNGNYNVVNKGTVNIAAKDIAVNGEFVNNAAMTIGAGADVKANVTNTKVEKDVDAIITNNGFMQSVTNNKDAVVNLGKGGIIASGTNATDGIIRTAEDAQVSLSSNDGDVIYVSGAAIVVGSGNGDIAYEAAGTINDALYAELKGAKVTKLIIDGAVSVTTKGLATETTTPIFNKIVAKAGSLVVDKNITLNTGDLTVEESLTTGGAINVTDEVTVNKDAILTNNGTISSVDFTNYGRVNNNGTVNVEQPLKDYGDWMYNDANDNTSAMTEKEKAMKAAVEKWSNYWWTWLDNGSSQHYAGNPYDYSKFIETVNVGNLNWQPTLAELKEAGFTEDNLKTDKPVEPSEFKVAVTNVLNTKKSTAEPILGLAANSTFKMTFSSRDNMFKKLQEVYDNMCTAIAGKYNTENNFGGDAIASAYAWADQVNVYNAFIKVEANKYVYIWEGCTLDKVVDLFKQAGDEGVDTWKLQEGTHTGSDVANWVRHMLNIQNPSDAQQEYIDAIKALGVTAMNANDKVGGYTKEQVAACVD